MSDLGTAWRRWSQRKLSYSLITSTYRGVCTSNDAKLPGEEFRQLIWTLEDLDDQELTLDEWFAWLDSEEGADSVSQERQARVYRQYSAFLSGT